MIKQFLQQLSRGVSTGQPEPNEAAIRDKLPLTTCVLMVELAHADEQFTEDERQHIMNTMMQRFGLSGEDASDLISLAEHTRNKSHDMWRFTNIINQSCTNAEKERIIEEVWRVVYADGMLDGHEDYLMHRLGKLLNLNHRDVIGAKLKAQKPKEDPGTE